MVDARVGVEELPLEAPEPRRHGRGLLGLGVLFAAFAAGEEHSLSFPSSRPTPAPAGGEPGSFSIMRDAPRSGAIRDRLIIIQPSGNHPRSKRLDNRAVPGRGTADAPCHSHLRQKRRAM